MSTHNGIIVRIVPTVDDTFKPKGKLANAELIFGVTDDLVQAFYGDDRQGGIGHRLGAEWLGIMDAMRLMSGLRVVEFGIWWSHTRNQRYVTMPNRTWHDDAGRKCRVSIIRPSTVGTGVEHDYRSPDLARLSQYILDAYAAWEVAQPATAVEA